MGQNVLDSQLASRLSGIANIPPQQIHNARITGLFQIIPSQYHNAALEAFNESLRTCFQVGLVMACIAIIGALGMEWRNVKKEKGSATRENPEDAQCIESGKELKEAKDVEDAASGANV